jgi:hypothetical protein
MGENEVRAIQRLPGSAVQCRESKNRLALRLPARPLRMAKSFAVPLGAFTGLLLLVAYLAQGWLLTVFGMGAVAAIVLSIAFASLADAYLTTTLVLITKSGVVVKAVLYGKKKTQQYALARESRARQWFLPPSPDFMPRGIEIGPVPSDPEAGSDWRDKTKPRFGACLSQGESDWVEWRINRFLGGATETASAPLAGVSSQPVPRPEGTKVRIEEDGFETRIYYPNGIETRSFDGLGSAIFGLGWSPFSLYLLLSQKQQLFDSGAFIGYGLLGLFALVSLMFLLTGLTRLFGRRQLTIGPERITYQVRLFGIGPWQTLRTGAVLSCGGLRDIAGGGKAAIAPAKECVIRTADSELPFGEVLRTRKEFQWVASEVARRILAARSAT